MMHVTPATRLDQILAAIPDAQETLHALRIDYANRATLSLADACALSGADLESALALLEAARVRDGRPIIDWENSDLHEVTRYIVEQHHRYTREALVEIESLSAQLCPAHQTHSRQIDRLCQVLKTFRGQMTRHMLEEEQVLFPYIERLAAAASSDVPIQPPFFETVRRPINKLVVEHGESFELLEEAMSIRDLVPRDCRDAFAPLFERVRALEDDIRQHMFLENTALLPRAVQLEAALESRFSLLGELW